MAYEKKYGRTRSVDSENRYLMGENIAEDGVTVINPSQGIMAGYCYESKKHKEGVKRRWYCLKDNIFKWYHPEKKVTGLKFEKENGSIDIVDVQEILEYSTAGNLQNISRCGFVIKTNKVSIYIYLYIIVCVFTSVRVRHLLKIATKSELKTI